MGLRKMFELRLANFYKAKITSIGLTWLVYNIRTWLKAVFSAFSLFNQIKALI